MVTDVLQKHKQKLQHMIDQNMRSEYLGLNIMDDIRLKQIAEIDLCLEMWKNSTLRAALAEPEDTRVCTCHPDDNPPQPCPRQYALDECRKATLAERQPTAKLECCAGGPVTEFCCGYPKLAEPQQEPVAWSYWQSCLNDDGTQTAPWVHRLSKFKPDESIINKDIVPLYTTPPHRKPLTDEEIEELCWTELDRRLLSFARAIEAAHGIKE